LRLDDAGSVGPWLSCCHPSMIGDVAMATQERPKTGTHTLTVRMPDDVFEALRTHAFASGTSANDVVVRSVIDFLSAEGRDGSVQALLAAAQERYRGALDRLKDL
jgi:hypothetical protein